MKINFVIQVVTEVVCVFTYLLSFNVLLTSSITIARLALSCLSCNVVSVSVLAWKLSFVTMGGLINWLRKDCSLDYV